MRTYSLVYTYREGYRLDFRELPLWHVVLDMVCCSFGKIVQRLFGRVKFPNIKLIRSEGEWYTFREWYGDIGTALEIFLVNPILMWLLDRELKKYPVVHIDIKKDEARKIDPEFVRYTSYKEKS